MPKRTVTVEIELNEFPTYEIIKHLANQELDPDEAETLFEIAVNSVAQETAEGWVKENDLEVVETEKDLNAFSNSEIIEHLDTEDLTEDHFEGLIYVLNKQFSGNLKNYFLKMIQENNWKPSEFYAQNLTDQMKWEYLEKVIDHYSLEDFERLLNPIRKAV